MMEAIRLRQLVIENRSFERLGMVLISSRPILQLTNKSSMAGQTSKLGGRGDWRLALALDTGGFPGSSSGNSINNESPGRGSTRLARIGGSGGRQLLQKLNSARKDFPMKIFLLLLGFYTANALTMILGQTGDWDVLVAGVVAVAIEGIGMLMYRKPPSLTTGKLQSLVTMINYWKAGVCLSFFVDAFKVGS